MPDAGPALSLKVPQVAFAVGAGLFVILSGVAWLQARSLAARREGDPQARFLARFCAAILILGLALCAVGIFRPAERQKRQALEAARSAAVLTCGLMALLFAGARRDAVTMGRLRNRIKELEGDLGGIVSSAGEVRKIAEATRHKAEMASVTDALTGIGSRRFFDEVLVRELRRSKRTERPVGLLLMEVDFLDKYTASFGTQATEQLLVAVANRLKGDVRDTDIFARFSESRFAMLMPETDLRGAIEIGEWLRSLVANAPLPHKDQMPGQRISISVGVGSFPVPLSDAPGFVGAVEAVLALASGEKNKLRSVQ